jgi:hypothetical protein
MVQGNKQAMQGMLRSRYRRPSINQGLTTMPLGLRRTNKEDVPGLSLLPREDRGS